MLLFKMNPDSSCTISEQDLVQRIIKEKRGEIGLGASRALTCNFYQTIQDNAPNIIFMDYEQTNVLHKILADKYCPTLELPIETNTAVSKKLPIFVKLQNSDNNNVTTTTVPLDEWMIVKRSYLEWSLRLRGDMTCQAKTRQMEDQIFEFCDDHIWKP